MIEEDTQSGPLASICTRTHTQTCTCAQEHRQTKTIFGQLLLLTSVLCGGGILVEC